MKLASVVLSALVAASNASCSPGDGNCLECDPLLVNCEQCISIDNITNALRMSYTEPLDGTCQLFCQPGYGLLDSQPLTCKACVDNCDSCNNNVCTMCNPGYHLLDGQCLACPDNCNVCTNPLLGAACETCNIGYYLQNVTCTACFNNCKLCDASDTCDECMAGYRLDDPNTCTACGSNCAYCQGLPDEFCDECMDGGPRGSYVLNTTGEEENSKTCILRCNANDENVNFTKNEDGKDCTITCAKPNPDNGAWVVNGANDNCDFTCNPGYRVEGSTCAACGSNCKVCDATACTQCNANPSGGTFAINGTTKNCDLTCKSNPANGVYAANVANTDCVLTCNPGYRVEGSTCAACGSNCKVCDATACTECNANPSSGTFAINGTTKNCDLMCNSGFFGAACAACAANCTDGQYESTACTTTSNRVCSACDACTLNVVLVFTFQEITTADLPNIQTDIAAAYKVDKSQVTVTIVTRRKRAADVKVRVAIKVPDAEAAAKLSKEIEAAPLPTFTATKADNNAAVLPTVKPTITTETINGPAPAPASSGFVVAGTAAVVATLALF